MQSNNIIKNFSSEKMVIIFLAFFIITSIIINGKPFGVAQLKEITNGTGIIDLEFNYNTDRAYDLFNKLGENGRCFYLKSIFFIDLIFPISYCLFLSSAFLFFLRKNNIHLRQIVFIPTLALLSDYTENFLLLSVFLNYPNKMPTIISIANIFTIAKFIFIILSYLMVFILIIVLANRVIF